MMSRVRVFVTSFAALALVGRASAATGTLRDRGVQPSGSETEQEPAKLPWRGSSLTWDHAVTTQTLGLGGDYQSRDPTYEMTFRLAPRYYFFDQRERSLSLRADVRLLREFTDSDSTTERGEWTFADSELSLTGLQTVYRDPGSRSQLVLRLPTLIFPTSKTSALGGRILGLGLGVGLDQELTLLGKNAPALLSAVLRPRFNYSYQFAEAVVATNDRIDRIRLDSDGRSLPSDQLTGSTLPQHQLSASLRGELSLTPKLVLEAELGARYARRYRLPATTLCVANGCAEVPARSDATRWGVTTLFSTALSYELGELLELSAGYANLSPELGADGRRRNVLYSPEARVFVALSVALDSLYQTASGQTPRLATHDARTRVAPSY